MWSCFNICKSVNAISYIRIWLILSDDPVNWHENQNIDKIQHSFMVKNKQTNKQKQKKKKKKTFK